MKSSHNLRNHLPAVGIIITVSEGILFIKKENLPDTAAFDHGDILNDYFTGRYL